MAFDDFLDQTCGIYELLPQKDVLGGIRQVWVFVQNAKCLVRPMTGGIDRDEGKDGSQATHNILLKGRHDLSAKNQIKVGTYVYNVIKCNDWNSLSHHTTVECILETS